MHVLNGEGGELWVLELGHGGLRWYGWVGCDGRVLGVQVVHFHGGGEVFGGILGHWGGAEKRLERYGQGL